MFGLHCRFPLPLALRSPPCLLQPAPPLCSPVLPLPCTAVPFTSLYPACPAHFGGALVPLGWQRPAMQGPFGLQRHPTSAGRRPPAASRLAAPLLHRAPHCNSIQVCGLAGVWAARCWHGRGRRRCGRRRARQGFLGCSGAQAPWRAALLLPERLRWVASGPGARIGRGKARLLPGSRAARSAGGRAPHRRPLHCVWSLARSLLVFRDHAKPLPTASSRLAPWQPKSSVP